MKKLLGLLALLALAGVTGRSAMAQDSQVDVGRVYLSLVGFSRHSFQHERLEASASFNVNSWLTAAADFDGTYTNTLLGRRGSTASWVGRESIPWAITRSARSCTY